MSELTSDSVALIGREAEATYLIERLRTPETRLVTLFGADGVGKTRLALTALAALSAHFTDGVYCVSLPDSDDEELYEKDLRQRYDSLALLIANALALRFIGEEAAKTLPPMHAQFAPKPIFSPYLQLLNYLQTRQILLLLDDFDSSLMGADFVRGLLKNAPGLTILLTSRERLNVAAEYAILVQGLPIPTDARDPRAAHTGSVRLFAAAATHGGAGFRLDAETLPAVIHICQMVAGIPWAIEMAAACLRASPNVKNIAQAIAARLNADTGENTSDEDHVLAAVFEVVWGLLAPKEQRTLAQLTLFQGGFTTSAALAVGPHTTLHALEEYRLIQRQPANAEGTADRYVLPRYIAAFAAAKLLELSAVAQKPHFRQLDPEMLRQQHSHYYLNLLEQYEPPASVPFPRKIIAELLLERKNIETAWMWAATRLHCAMLHRALRGLARFYQHLGLFQEGEVAFSQAAERVRPLTRGDSLPPRGKQVLLTLLLLEQVRCLNAQARYDAAILRVQECITVAQACGERAHEAAGYLEWGLALAAQGHNDAATLRLEKALELAQNHALQIAADSLHYLGCIALQTQNYIKAQTYFEHALRQQHESGDLQGECFTLDSLGVIAAQQGYTARANAYFEQSLYLCGALNDRRGEVQTLHHFGEFLNTQGDYAAAQACLNTALQIYRELQEPHGECQMLSRLGQTYLHLGAYDQAQGFLENAIALAETLFMRREKSLALSCLAALYSARGQAATACDYAREAQRIAAGIPAPDLQSEALIRLGDALLHLDDLEGAAHAYHQASDMLAPAPSEALAGLAQVALRRADLAPALAHIESLLPRLAQPVPLYAQTTAPLSVYLTCFHVLRAHDDPRAANLLEAAYRLLHTRADCIHEDTLRQTYLENIIAHRDIHMAATQLLLLSESCH